MKSDYYHIDIDSTQLNDAEIHAKVKALQSNLEAGRIIATFQRPMAVSLCSPKLLITQIPITRRQLLWQPLVSSKSNTPRPLPELT